VEAVMTNSSKPGSARSRLHDPISSTPAPGTDANGRAGVYTRFIPREELSSFSAWQPGNFGDDPARKPKAAPDPEVLRREAELARQRAQQAAAEALVREEQQRQDAVRQAREGGYQDGYRDGLAAMESFKQSYAAQCGAQVAAVIQKMHDRLEQVELDLAQRVGGIALDVARQVVRSELAQRPEHVVAVTQEALSVLLVSARHVAVRLHPDDHALVVQGCAELLSARGARVVADPQLERGDCLVESDIGTVDARVATRWRLAAEAFGRKAAWTAPAEDEPSALSPNASGADQGARS